MDDWRTRPAAGQARAMAAGRLDPRALAESYLDAIAAQPGAARIYARTTPERARAEAAAAAARLAAGRPAGPLDGVALAWKDNVDTAGTATEAGSRLLAGRVPAADAEALALATRAGTVCLGKTHMSELAFSGLGLNPMAETPPNALDPALAPGGSSAGSAVAVALGLAAAAVGTDTGGSVRIPAAWNGLVGLRTTPGLVSCAGVVPLAANLDTVGPMTRTVEDAALLLGALTGRDFDAGPAAPAGLALRIAGGVWREGCDAPVAAAWEAALDRLGRAGVKLADGPLPELDGTAEVSARLSPLVTREAWDAWGTEIEARPGLMWDRIEARFRAGLSVPPDRDAEARAAFAQLARQIAARIGAEGLVALPTCPNLPPPIDRLMADEAFYAQENMRALSHTRLANMLGLPALTLPLPDIAAGLMLFGPPGSEARLLAAGAGLAPVLAG